MKKKRLNARRQGDQAPPAVQPEPNGNPQGALPEPQVPVPAPPASEPLPAVVELRLEGRIVLDESSMATSPMLPYVRMVVSLIEGVEFTFREVMHLLGQAMRQHSIGVRRRIDYLLGFLHQHPP